MRRWEVGGEKLVRSKSLYGPYKPRDVLVYHE